MAQRNGATLDQLVGESARCWAASGLASGLTVRTTPALAAESVAWKTANRYLLGGEKNKEFTHLKGSALRLLRHMAPAGLASRSPPSAPAPVLQAGVPQVCYRYCSYSASAISRTGRCGSARPHSNLVLEGAHHFGYAHGSKGSDVPGRAGRSGASLLRDRRYRRSGSDADRSVTAAAGLRVDFQTGRRPSRYFRPAVPGH